MKELKPAPGPTRAGIRAFELPADLAAVLAELERIAGGIDQPVVDDPAMLHSLWTSGFPPPVHILADSLDRLVALRYVRRVFIGSEPHLVVGDRPVVQRRHSSDVGVFPSREDELFRLELASDIEHEKVILYRVVLVLEGLAALLLLRQLFVA